MNYLVKAFVKEYEDVENPKVRARYGRLSGIVGIVLNLLLCAGKFIAGVLSGAVSVTADAVHNLTDAGASVIELVGFYLARKPADEEHPFGHARIEYIASLSVAFLIVLLGAELIKTSATEIFHPEQETFSLLTVVILLVSIGAKLWMYFFNRRLSKTIDSVALQATAADSFSDTLATGAVLVSAILSPVLHFSLDGYMGVTVAVLILISAYRILKETLSKLLGEAPTAETTQLLKGHLLKQEGVLALHDVVVHSYGPGKIFATAHVEMDARENVLRSHERIDNIEREVLRDHGINLVIHMDPVVVDDPEANILREKVKTLILDMDDGLTMHDFRVVKGESRSRLIFDVVVPYECPISEKEMRKHIIAGVRAIDPKYSVTLTIDRAYA